MSPGSAKDLRAQLRSAAAGTGRQAKDPKAVGGDRPTPGPKRVRITVDLDREDHRALRRWVAEEETDAQRVVRALLSELFHDSELAARVSARVSGTRFR